MKRSVKELLPYVIIIIFVVTIRTYIITPVSVNGNSMEHTLSHNDVMLLYKLGKINRYDIVVLEKNNDKLIKRVIALPGEKIKCVSGIIYVNNEEITDYGFGTSFDFPETILGNDEYYVMGDNHGDSLDSRYFGPIKEENILGTTNIRIYPLTKLGKVD